MNKYWVKVTIFAVIAIPVLAGSVFGADFQTWSDVATICQFAEDWRYDGDQGIRGVLSDSDFTQIYFRPSLRYQARPWLTLHGGIRFIRTYWDDENDTFEIGPWQGLRFIGPRLGNYPISQYFRLEERMTWETEGDRDFDFTVRARYQLGAQTPVYDIFFKNGIYMLGSIEPFWNVETPIFINRIRYRDCHQYYGSTGLFGLHGLWLKGPSPQAKKFPHNPGNPVYIKIIEIESIPHHFI